MSGTILHGGDRGKGKLYFPLLKFFLPVFIELKTSFTMSFNNNHYLNKLYNST